MAIKGVPVKMQVKRCMYFTFWFQSILLTLYLVKLVGWDGFWQYFFVDSILVVFKAVTCHHCKIHQVPVLGLVSCHRKGLLAARHPKLPSLASRSHTSLPSLASRSHTSLPSHLKAALNPNRGDWLEEPCMFWVMERGNQLTIIRLFCWNSCSTMIQHPEKLVRKLILVKFYFGVVGFNHMIVWYQ